MSLTQPVTARTHRHTQTHTHATGKCAFLELHHQVGGRQGEGIWEGSVDTFRAAWITYFQSSYFATFPSVQTNTAQRWKGQRGTNQNRKGNPEEFGREEMCMYGDMDKSQEIASGHAEVPNLTPLQSPRSVTYKCPFFLVHKDLIKMA